MKKLVLLIIFATINTCNAASTFIVDPALQISHDDIFSPENQCKYVVDGMIAFGPDDQFSYSVFEKYTIRERQYAFQLCEKWLKYDDPVRLLYMYQFVVKPYPYPINGCDLYTLPDPLSVDCPMDMNLLIIGIMILITGIKRFRRII